MGIKQEGENKIDRSSTREGVEKEIYKMGVTEWKSDITWKYENKSERRWKSLVPTPGTWASYLVFLYFSFVNLRWKW